MSAAQQIAAPPMLAAMQARRPAPAADRVAIYERDGEGIRETSFGSLHRQVRAAVGWLRERGVGERDIVAVWLPNWTEYLVLEFALAAIGATLLGVNTRYGVHELTGLIRRGRPAGVIAPTGLLSIDFAGTLGRAWEDAAEGDVEPPWVATVRGPGVPELDLGAGLFAVPSFASAALATQAGDLFEDHLINGFTTSGSTGEPKLAGHDQAAVVEHSRAVATALNMDPDSVFLAALPLTGVFGFNPVMGALAAGGSCLLQPVFETATALGDMQALGVTHVLGGDDLIGRLKDGWDEDSMRLSLRDAGIADFAGRSAECIAWAEQAWGVKMRGVYGSSELFALVSAWPQEMDAEDRARGGGSPVSARIEVRVVDPDTDEELPPGRLGELQFRGYNVLDGYLGAPALLAQSKADAGWFRSGDLGELTGDGADFVYVCRKGDALRLRGFLVEPEEIEQVLDAHPRVEATRVAGAERSGADVAVGFVLLSPGDPVGEDELLAHCRAELAPFKVPVRIEVLGEFPVVAGPNGTKVRMVDLRRRAADLLAHENNGGKR